MSAVRCETFCRATFVAQQRCIEDVPPRAWANQHRSRRATGEARRGEPMNDLPQPIAELVNMLAAMPGAVAVVLGGSRALGSNDAGSDWDLGLYYRHAIDLTALATRGTVFPPGSWVRGMNGGAWLRC